MKLLVLLLLFGVWGFYLQAQENDRFSLIEELRVAPDDLFGGPRINYEIVLSFLGFVNLTYVQTFGSEKNPFNLGNDYVNLTVSVPLIIRNR